MRLLWVTALIVCLLPDWLVAGERAADSLPPLRVAGVNDVILVDRLIADRAYANIKAGRAADHGIDFKLLEGDMEKHRPELEKIDPAYYETLRATYERMKAYVTDPESDFVRAVRHPGSVEFPGRSPLPAAAFTDPPLHRRP